MRRFSLLLAALLLTLSFSVAQAGGHKNKAKGSAANSAATQAPVSDGKAKNNDKAAHERDKDTLGHDRNIDAPDSADDSDRSASRGNERSQEMRQRRDERKEIQEEYRANREPGQEGDKSDGQAGKKPWYKFWE